MAGPRTDKTGQIQTQKQSNGQQLASLLQKMRRQIQMALPRHFPVDRMARIALTALRQTPGLDQCTPASFLGCVLQCAQLGLEPNTPLGHAYLIPRWNKHINAKECTLIIGYKGYMDMSRRSGLVAGIKGYVVREGDAFEYSEGLEPKLVHVPSDDAERERRPVTHAYAIARMKEGPAEFEVLSKSQVDARMARSETAGKSFSPWKSDYEAMAKKSAVRALWKWLPNSTEIARAEAIEVAADTHSEQSDAWDPAVNDALTGGGLLPPPSESVDSETSEVADQPYAEESSQ